MAIFVTSSEVCSVALPSYHRVFQRSFSDSEQQQYPLICASTTHISGQPALLALNVTGKCNDCLLNYKLCFFRFDYCDEFTFI